MNIKYMKLLQDNPVQTPDDTIDFSIRSFDEPLTEIKRLEDKYNQGNKFPKAFRELLFIAGEDCWARESAWSFEECMDDSKHRLEVEAGYDFGRPYFVFEDGQSGDCARIFYLDEDDDDPVLHHVDYNSDWDDVNDVETFDIQISDFYGILTTLTALIEKRVRWNIKRLQLGIGY
jgi:hypothetical protein